MTKNQVRLRVVVLALGMINLWFICHLWPKVGYPILACLALGCLATMTTIAVLIYGRLQGINLAAVDYELRERRNSKRQMPFGR